MTSSETLRSLSEPVRTRLRSTHILTSLPQVVSQLVQNSLDASASHIDIGIDCQEWECWVKDDGNGIPRSGLDALSKSYEAGRYNTSKAHTLDSLEDICTFGFRGEALASAADVSCMEISSRTASPGRHVRRILKTWKNGHCLYNGPAARWRMEHSGTVVYLRDIFHNLPIRRNSHSRPSKTMEIICRDIETLALVFPRVSFTVNTVRQLPEIGPRTDRVLHIPKSTSILSAFRHINGKALADEVDEVAVSSGAAKIDGFISLRGSHINRHPLSPSHLLHRNIDQAFSNSSFSKNASCPDVTDHSPRHIRRSPRKLDRKPIYVLSLTVPPKDIDNCLEPGKSLIHVSNEDAIGSFFDSVIQTFLVRHGFLSGDVQPAPQKRRRVITGVGDKPDMGNPRQTSDSAPSDTHGTMTSTRKQSDLPPLHVNPVNDGDENGVVETKFNSGVTFLFKERTDQSYPCTLLSQESHESSTRAIIPTRRTIAVPDSGDWEDEYPSWILDALKDNSAYFVREKLIPSVSQRLPNFLPLTSEPVAPTCATHPSLYADGSFILDRPSTWCLRKDDLARINVINQLDRKFILCAVDEIKGSDDSRQESDNLRRMLVLVDQHAASERVRVEGFLRTLCHNFLELEGNGSQSPDRLELDPPRMILLSRKEASILRSTQSILGRWCLELSWPESKSCDQSIDQDEYEQFLVHSVPRVVSEKLLAGDELRNFFKEYAAESETDGVLPALGSQSQHGDPDHLTWHKALRWCPKGLLALINSRACRGAIMFNDSLSIEQCERLMAQLAETAFPFQCAHGRPSLVPLTGTSECAFGQGQRRKVDWERSGPMLASLGIGMQNSEGVS
ncbi:hypothetical protein BGY98DRAFT_955130 [Russula aff. rugulosa BPL654]|nr:hypothetical protein BGY98DRAFT_955130 [Russula aff. rugulosa BPL654]